MARGHIAVAKCTINCAVMQGSLTVILVGGERRDGEGTRWGVGQCWDKAFYNSQGKRFYLGTTHPGF